MLEDLRYGARVLARTPGFTVAAVLALAIGIGANTAILSVTNSLLLRPLPYRDADRLTILWSRSPGLDIAQDWFSTAQYFDIAQPGKLRGTCHRDWSNRQLDWWNRRAGTRRDNSDVVRPVDPKHGVSPKRTAGIQSEKIS